jgi:CRISPR-associated protein Csm3
MPTQLLAIRQFTATIRLHTGLLIGAGDSEIHIGGADKTVQRHPHTRNPYIPGSSLKGKIRSLLEWRAGVVGLTDGAPLRLEDLARITSPAARKQAEAVVRLFGHPPSGKERDRADICAVGPTRLAFADASLSPAWLDERKRRNEAVTEVKAEVGIDRITGTANRNGPRFFERVPAGAEFDFVLRWKVLDGDDQAALRATVLAGIKLLELDGLGGQVSRGYGRLHFVDPKLDDEPLRDALDALDPFAGVA